MAQLLQIYTLPIQIAINTSTVAPNIQVMYKVAHKNVPIFLWQ